jgi:hypothetical protein
VGRRSNHQRQMRRDRGERAFLFTHDLATALAELDRDEWQTALSMKGGDTAAAAAMCGIADVPRNARALWGRSAEEARSTYRRWQKRRGK